MFNLEKRTTWDNLKLTGTFGFLGGYTAMLSLVILGIFVNCMTGNVTRTGLALGSFEYQTFIEIIFVFFSFVFGSYVSTRLFDKFGHIAVLALEITLLFLIGEQQVPLFIAPCVAAMAMGLQNALTTCVSWNFGKIRTTHVTGSSTDIGIALSEFNFTRAARFFFLLVCYVFGAFFALSMSRIFDYRAFTLGAAVVFAAVVVDILGKFFKGNKFFDSSVSQIEVVEEA